MVGSYDGSIRIDTSIKSQSIDNGTAIENKIKKVSERRLGLLSV